MIYAMFKRTIAAIGLILSIDPQVLAQAIVDISPDFYLTAYLLATTEVELEAENIPVHKIIDSIFDQVNQKYSEKFENLPLDIGKMTRKEQIDFIKKIDIEIAHIPREKLTALAALEEIGAKADIGFELALNGKVLATHRRRAFELPSVAWLQAMLHFHSLVPSQSLLDLTLEESIVAISNSIRPVVDERQEKPKIIFDREAFLDSGVDLSKRVRVTIDDDLTFSEAVSLVIEAFEVPGQPKLRVLLSGDTDKNYFYVTAQPSDSE